VGSKESHHQNGKRDHWLHRIGRGDSKIPSNEFQQPLDRRAGGPITGCPIIRCPIKKEHRTGTGLSPTYRLLVLHRGSRADLLCRTLVSDRCYQASFFRCLNPQLAYGQLVSLLLQTGNVSSSVGSGPSS